MATVFVRTTMMKLNKIFVLLALPLSHTQTHSIRLKLAPNFAYGL